MLYFECSDDGCLERENEDEEEEEAEERMVRRLGTSGENDRARYVIWWHFRNKDLSIVALFAHNHILKIGFICAPAESEEKETMLSGIIST